MKDPSVIMTFKKSELLSAYQFLACLDSHILDGNPPLLSFYEKVSELLRENEKKD